jgi:membrane associated rhomboid family serine protease
MSEPPPEPSDDAQPPPPEGEASAASEPAAPQGSPETPLAGASSEEPGEPAPEAAPAPDPEPALEPAPEVGTSPPPSSSADALPSSSPEVEPPAPALEEPPPPAASPAPLALAALAPSDHEALHAEPYPPEPPPEAEAPQARAPEPQAPQTSGPLALPAEEYGRLVAFVVALLSTGIFLNYGLSPDDGPTLRSLALGTSAWTEFSTQGWRLISGTLTHTNLWIGLVSVLLLLVATSEFESRAGRGGTLLLLIPGGAALNLLRIQVEPDNTLFHASGGWCIALAAGIGASVLARRRGENPKHPLTVVAVQVLIFAAFLFFTGHWDNSLLTSAGGAALLGGALGLVWPSGVRTVEGLSTPPRSQAPLRVGAGLLALALVGAALLQARSNETGPPEREPIPAITKPFVAEPLLVELKLPAGWSEYAVPKEVECGTCGTKAEWDRALVNDPIPGPKQCKNCSDEVLHGNRYVAYYIGGGGMLGGPQRLLFLQAQDNLQIYDADTLIEEVVQRQFRRDDSEFREAAIESEEFFATPAYERGFRLILRGKKERITFYAFKTKKRMVLLMFRGPAPTNPLSVAWEDAFHQAIVETAKPWKPKKKPKQEAKDEAKTSPTPGE